MGKALILTNQGIKVNSSFSGVQSNFPTATQSLFTVPSDQYVILSVHMRLLDAFFTPSIQQMTLLLNGNKVFTTFWDGSGGFFDTYSSRNSANDLTKSYQNAASVRGIYCGPGSVLTVQSSIFGIGTFVFCEYYGVSFSNQ